MIKAIISEIYLRRGYLEQSKLETIYFGGGTPSILNQKNLELIFKGIHEVFDTSEVKEITLEANPDDISLGNLQEWQNLGINRISLGIQTFNDEYLRLMNRVHSGREAKKALEMVLNQGFETSSADIIYAKTGFSFDEISQYQILKSDLNILTSFNLQHISAYNLSIEDKTVFGEWTKKGKLFKTDDDYAARQYQQLTQTLADEEFEQYEISNFARNSKYALHNTSYWQNDEYLGLGPGAHSYNKFSRQWNVSNNHLYMKAIEGNSTYFETEILSVEEKFNEYLLTGLRTKWGINLNRINEISENIPAEFWTTLNAFISQGQLVQLGQNITITQEARILSDKITSDLFWIK